MYPNKVNISNGEGQVSITAISRAFEVGQVAEDFDLSKYTSVEHDNKKNLSSSTVTGKQDGQATTARRRCCMRKPTIRSYPRL